jgi:hypothetical protein
VNVYHAPDTSTQENGMALYKRRIVYLSDAEWGKLHDIAKTETTSVSSLVRRLIETPYRPVVTLGGPEHRAGTSSPIATEPNTLKESPQDPQRARRDRQKRIDAVLRKANKP